MGDILQILIIIGFIIFAVVRQAVVSSEKEKKRQQRPPVALPKEEDEDWEEVKSVKELPKPFLSYDYGHFAPSTDTMKQSIPPPPLQEEPDIDDSKFDIHSTEEVRRAIIWSEILNRKY